MLYQKIDPKDFPIEQGESWWVVHPNQRESEFYAPVGAITICTQYLTIPPTREVAFCRGTVYTITSIDRTNGWITVSSTNRIVEMPYYVFARYFDAEAFVRARLSSKEQAVLDLEEWNG